MRTAGIAVLLLLLTAAHSAAEVGTRASLSMSFFSPESGPPIFQEDPAGGDYRIGATSSQASVNSSGSGHNVSGSASGSISGSGAMMAVNSAISIDEAIVRFPFAHGEAFMWFDTGVSLPAGAGRATLSLTITLNGSLTGDSAVTFAIEGFPSGVSPASASYSQVPRPGGGTTIIVDRVSSEGTGAVNHTFTWSAVPFDFGLFPEPAPLRFQARLSGATGSGTAGEVGPGEAAVTARISGVSLNILEHTPLGEEPSDDRSFRWIGPSAPAPSGSFAEASNWRGVENAAVQQVPVKNDERADTAVFDLPAAYSVNVGMQRTERLRVAGGNVTFTNADYEVAALSLAEPGTVIDNASLTLAGGELRSVHTLIGERAGSQLVVTGENTNWRNQGRLSIGGDGEARMVIDQKAMASSGETRIGTGTSLVNEAIVRNLGLWDPGNLAVGNLSEGKLTVERGGFVSAGQVRLGEFEGVNGELRVEGMESAINRSRLEAEAIDVGFEGAGRLLIEAGGHVKTADMTIASSLLDAGGVSVSGGQGAIRSTLQADVLRLGRGPDRGGLLLIFEGGSVTALEMVIGGLAPGEVIVSGAGGEHRSTLSASLNIGPAGGTLSIGTGALVTSASAWINRGEEPEAFGKVVVSSAEGLSEWRIGSSLRVDGTLEVSHGGAVTVGNIEPSARMVRLGPGGSLSGEGTIVAAEGVESAAGVDNFAGTVNPGSSPGTLTIEGDYAQGASGVLRVEVGGLGEGEFDRLVVTGNAALGGILEVRFLDDFLPRAGDSVDFLDVQGSVTGEFTRMRFPQLTPDFEAELSFTDEGKLRLTAESDGTRRPECTGDCNEDGVVTIDELLAMVGIALGGLLADCLPGDADGNAQITVAEIVAAVQNALRGCAAGALLEAAG